MNSKFSINYIILFCVLSASVLAQHNDIKIISSGAGSLVFEYSPSFSDSTYIKIDNENYLSVSLNYGFISGSIQAGMPSIPERIINTAVPSEFGNTIEIVKASYKEFNAKLVPVPGIKMENGIPTPFYQLSDNYSNYKPSEDLAVFDQYGIARGIPVQSLRMMPVKYFPQQGIVRVYYDIIVKVNFKSGNKILYAPKDEFAKDIVLNYDAVKYWTRPVNKALYKTVSNSVLATGKWVRFEASEEGIYKISKSDLAAYGIDASVDPRTIKIYNNSGKMLSESVEKVVPTDLVEVAVYVSGESDGVFNDDDYILFYGRGTNFYEYDAGSKNLKRAANYYSNQNYYWITSGGAPGKRMETKNSAEGNSAYVQTSTKALVYLEDEKINLCKSSREFFGDEFNINTKSRVYTNKLDYLVPSSTIQYNFRFINTDYNSIELKVDENQTQLIDFNIDGRRVNGIYADLTGGISAQRTCTYSSQLPDNRSNLKFFFNASDVSSKGYLDFFEIYYDKYLTALNDQLVFIAKDTSSVIEYDLNGFSNSNIKTFDVSDYSAPKIVSAMLISGGEFRFKSIETAGSGSKYLAVGNNNYKTPSNQKTMSNQNLHGMSEGAKVIVVTNKLFIDQANKYKAYRESNSKNKLSCVVIDIDEIFNEFSGGIVDPTGLRNFVKYAYDNWSITPEYILLFGDGTYDYKNIEKYNNNFLLTYQYDYTNFDDNINNLSTYSTDDYFARVEGEDLKTDLCIGRLPVNSADEAETVVDKIKHYENESDLGSWRNQITLLADDGYTSTGWDGDDHTKASEQIANNYIPESFFLNKIYMATYTAQITGNGRRIPQVTKDLLQSINDGTLVVNFIGHGSPEVWTHEYILEKNTFIPQMKNNRYFALIAGTCDFGYLDNPSDQSGAEMFVTDKDAGSIISFASNRLAWSNQNHDMLNAFYNNLFFSAKDSNNLPISIGKVVYLTKQARLDVNDQKYHLLGDPAIRLLQPQYNASIDSINGLYSPNNLVQLKALSKVQIAGSIKKNGTVQNDFNGEGILTVYDAGRTLFIPQISYTANILGGTIFKGRVSVANGKFSGDFVVPKDISYDNDRGKMTFYFSNSSVDGIGVNSNFTVGGTDTNSVTDTKGPDIKVYFDKESYTNTALVGPNSNLIIKLSDENGLNTTGAGIGHKLEGVLNDDESNSIDFSSYFTGDLDAGGKSGQVVYPLSSLDPGNYKLKVKAWDIYNNYSALTTDFTVMADNNLVLSDIYNYPNPFKQKTTFTFQQSIKKPIDVKIRIFSVAGRLIKELEQGNISKGFVTVDWDGRDQDGNLAANGVYLYKIIVKAIDGSVNKTALGKLAIVR
jgi:hypothetical protein